MVSRATTRAVSRSSIGVPSMTVQKKKTSARQHPAIHSVMKRKEDGNYADEDGGSEELPGPDQFARSANAERSWFAFTGRSPRSSADKDARARANAAEGVGGSGGSHRGSAGAPAGVPRALVDDGENEAIDNDVNEEEDDDEDEDDAAWFAAEEVEAAEIMYEAFRATKGPDGQIIDTEQWTVETKSRVQVRDAQPPCARNCRSTILSPKLKLPSLVAALARLCQQAIWRVRNLGVYFFYFVVSTRWTLDGCSGREEEHRTMQTNGRRHPAAAHTSHSPHPSLIIHTPLVSFPSPPRMPS